jgi:hypothetical protein
MTVSEPLPPAQPAPLEPATPMAGLAAEIGDCLINEWDVEPDGSVRLIVTFPHGLPDWLTPNDVWNRELFQLKRK